MSERSGWSEVAPGFFRLSVADVNCYLMQSADGITLFDAGLPRTGKVLSELLGHLGARRSDIDAVVLTHGHFDHVGTARALQDDGVTVVVHPGDAALARHPYRYRPATPRLLYVLGHPRGIPVITRMAAAGALTVRGVEAQPQVTHGHPVDVPGAPVALWTPGHTDGHCAYLFESQGVLIAGDALVTLDPYTGEEGPQIVANAATADPEAAIDSLETLAATGARVVLTGHGAPVLDGVGSAAAAARRRGPH
ncbi:MBL fold metallo-hydrolase [Microbacterium sp. SSW1-47]|uniref:MBL fold metallo-hydrolase n=1 Tax=Microbacterium TaxID=33882 RepID=UPI00109BA62F|nr:MULTISPECIES: MBL fold metallo-hydrolase [Microbacterium]MCK2027451.1 MBL fold metallo-hydrolase [Microbacterium sufflavum]